MTNRRPPIFSPSAPIRKAHTLRNCLTSICWSHSHPIMKLKKSLTSFSERPSFAPNVKNSMADLTIARWCVETIETASDEQLKGIYLQNGKYATMEEYQDCFDRGETPPREDVDLKAVASFLKRHIRRLPQTLIPDSLYADLATACTDFNKNHSCEALRKTVKKLSPVNHDMLKLLMDHLWRITRLRSLALVSPIALAISWTPNLFDTDSIAGQLKDSELAVYEASLAVAIRNFITETLITQADVIFQE